MARRRKPEDETTDDAERRRLLESVADNASRGEKVSWDRKMDNMVSLMAKLKPIEDQIMDLMGQKLPIIDEISALRKDMVRECVHPYTHLTDLGDGSVRCKFCERTVKVVQPATKKAKKSG